MCSPDSAAVVWHTWPALGFRAAALVLTHRNRIWLGLFFLPSKKGMREQGGSGTAFATPAPTYERASAHRANSS